MKEILSTQVTLSLIKAADKFYRTDFGRLAEIGNEGVLALLSDSANADSNVQVASMHEAGEEILNTIADCDGRVIVAAVASNIVRIQQIFDARSNWSSCRVDRT